MVTTAKLYKITKNLFFKTKVILFDKWCKDGLLNINVTDVCKTIYLDKCVEESTVDTKLTKK